MQRLKSLILCSLLVIPSVRVAIFKDLPKLTVEGENLWLLGNEPRPISHFIDSPALVTSTENGFKVGSQTFSYPVIKIGSRTEAVEIQGKQFKGWLEIKKDSNNQLLVLNELPLEDYLVGLVHGEIFSSWPEEAIKAQVVAARTYALFRQKQRRQSGSYDLESDTADQVYKGSLGTTQDNIVKEAVDATRGEVLWYLGMFPAYFHSTCGGQTEVAPRVWGKKEISSSIIDHYCKDSPHQDWELTLSHHQLLNALKNRGLTGSKIVSIQLERFDDSPRNAMIIIETDENNLYLKATDLRNTLGFKNLKSTWFDVELNNRHVVFKGTGYGHGVGLCQWGAKGMADQGADYKTILEHYYPKATLRKLY
ncbi:MAG: hypothetical protein A2W61_03780 [Deltaproteobacteria bacterium RIFCSPLOWO2_01_44_7]|nr:MAG: hypothetical protein A2712_08165 [Deltaproteobacteria bacterium RIFCSPHIGHO2_01_FULL_43_49]OGQ14688.1 MAG: hypothetical protein A3D22_08835 [Deltaproteobacteria bacterium RIFCSPHIGHO2_02_FULL_44_53]OGQ28074.1 MAG: hypothetical protein A3D98_07545 [Deltaproteobacteria bacterium RIFCSPHIGHO2_12_FULL_44_21]OGQ31286.1 MAG: hypothetical protein A2979_07595 [Deltaproteobacteria bacterium RIFCSPLOWO2_01_FULL_45_74]OGQ39913.1 MAG: hypothetical protein A2W61_03780 [Deltaproteobacteria bacterium 